MAIALGVSAQLALFSRRCRIKPAKVLLYQQGGSALGLPLLSWVTGEPGIVHLYSLIVFCLSYQIVWVAFITYLLWLWLMMTYPASQLASFLFLPLPLFGVIFGALLLGKTIGWACRPHWFWSRPTFTWSTCQARDRLQGSFRNKAVS